MMKRSFILLFGLLVLGFNAGAQTQIEEVDMQLEAEVINVDTSSGLVYLRRKGKDGATISRAQDDLQRVQTSLSSINGVVVEVLGDVIIMLVEPEDIIKL